jgi:single-strand DNA-binding protein
VNKIMIIGNLGRDPEMSYTPAGKAVTKFSLAVTRRGKDANGERKDDTTWFNVVAWERLGETCNTYLHKGSKVYVEGRMISREYTDKDGNKRTAWEVTATDMEMLTPRSEGSSAPGGTAPTDDLPF